MQFRKALLWSLINSKTHPSLNKKELTIESALSLIDALFPGLNFFSMSGFAEVMRGCAVPALKKRFPELKSMRAQDVGEDEKAEVSKFLPSKRYQWQDSKRWQRKFQKLLAA